MKMSDEALSKMITDCATSKASALEILYKHTAPQLNGYAYHILRSEALSNEVIQDSFIQIWQSASKYNEDRGKPYAWLCMIVRSRAIDKLRAEKKHARSDSFHLHANELEQTPSHQDPEKEVEKASASTQLHAGLSTLPTNSQLSLRLTYFHDYSGKDVAKKLDANLNTVKSWIRRGLNHLKNDKALAKASEL